MADRFCPNCQQSVHPTGHSRLAQILWIVLGLPVMLIGGILVAAAAGLGGGQVITVTENGTTYSVHKWLIDGVYMGLAIWLLGVVLEFTAYRQRCPICRTARLS
jgi:hypothetical protein